MQVQQVCDGENDQTCADGHPHHLYSRPSVLSIAAAVLHWLHPSLFCLLSSVVIAVVEQCHSAAAAEKRAGQ